MTDIESLLAELDEVAIAKNVGSQHDITRMQYRPKMNLVENFDEFSWLIGDYYNYHYTTCITRGGNLPMHEATGRAKELLTQEYRRRGGDIVSAYNDAHNGTNGGVRSILDILAQKLKDEAIERYIRDQFDRHVAPNSWDQKVEIIRQFIERNKTVLNPTIGQQPPERFAHNYEELIRSFTDGMRQTSTTLRRL